MKFFYVLSLYLNISLLDKGIEGFSQVNFALF